MLAQTEGRRHEDTQGRCYPQVLERGWDGVFSQLPDAPTPLQFHQTSELGEDDVFALCNPPQPYPCLWDLGAVQANEQHSRNQNCRFPHQMMTLR